MRTRRPHHDYVSSLYQREVDRLMIRAANMSSDDEELDLGIDLSDRQRRKAGQVPRTLDLVEVIDELKRGGRGSCKNKGRLGAYGLWRLSRLSR